jgi:hypothetical protein
VSSFRSEEGAGGHPPGVGHAANWELGHACRSYLNGQGTPSQPVVPRLEASHPPRCAALSFCHEHAELVEPLQRFILGRGKALY